MRMLLCTISIFSYVYIEFATLQYVGGGSWGLPNTNIYCWVARDNKSRLARIVFTNWIICSRMGYISSSVWAWRRSLVAWRRDKRKVNSIIEATSACPFADILHKQYMLCDKTNSRMTSPKVGLREICFFPPLNPYTYILNMCYYITTGTFTRWMNYAVDICAEWLWHARNWTTADVHHMRDRPMRSTCLCRAQPIYGKWLPPKTKSYQSFAQSECESPSQTCMRALDVQNTAINIIRIYVTAPICDLIFSVNCGFYLNQCITQVKTLTLVWITPKLPKQMCSHVRGIRVYAETVYVVICIEWWCVWIGDCVQHYTDIYYW